MLEACMNILFQNGHILVFFCLLANFIALVKNEAARANLQKNKRNYCIQKLLILVSSHELSWGILYLIFNKVEREREKNEMK